MAAQGEVARARGAMAPAVVEGRVDVKGGDPGEGHGEVGRRVAVLLAAARTVAMQAAVGAVALEGTAVGRSGG